MHAITARTPARIEVERLPSLVSIQDEIQFPMCEHYASPQKPVRSTTSEPLESRQKLKFKKPALIHSIFLPALQGPGSKMSSSVDISAIFMSDTENAIKKKINKYAFSGGQDTAELQREKGGNTKEDISFQYLTFFLEDDEELERIRVAYERGEMLSGDLKAICIRELQAFVRGFQERRRAVTDEIRDEFMRPRELVWRGNPNPVPKTKEGKGGDKGGKT